MIIVNGGFYLHFRKVSKRGVIVIRGIRLIGLIGLIRLIRLIGGRI